MVLIGKVVAAHGIKGAVKVISYAESINIFHSIDALWVSSDSQSDHRAYDRLKVNWVTAHKNIIRMGFAKIIDRNQAEAMVGRELFLEKSHLPELEDDTYYWFDLIGLNVMTSKDEVLGRIEAILPTGGNDVYVVKGCDDNNENEVLIPAVASVIQRIDLAKKIMVVDLPEGL
jgi:16S rRNA processing protein RimM